MKTLKVEMKGTPGEGGTLAEIYVYDVIGASFWGEGVTAKAVKQALNEAKGAKAVNVRVNSPGGDAFEGAAIYNVLRSAGLRITVDVDGLAASAASIICMAGVECRMGRGTQMMIHNASTMSVGDANEMRRQADVLDGISNELATIYEARTGKSLKDILKMMDGETWMNPEMAVEQGFATAVTEGRDAQACAIPTWCKYKNRPEWANIVEPQQETFEQAVTRRLSELKGTNNVIA